MGQRAHTLEKPLIWAGLLTGIDRDANRVKMKSVLTSLGVLGLPADEETRRINIAIELARVARVWGTRWAAGVSATSDIQIVIDRADAKRKFFTSLRRTA